VSDEDLPTEIVNSVKTYWGESASSIKEVAFSIKPLK
jgi:hypothetical protein